MRWIGRRASGNIDDRRKLGGPIAVGAGIVGIIILLLNQKLPADHKSAFYCFRSWRSNKFNTSLKILIKPIFYAK